MKKPRGLKISEVNGSVVIQLYNTVIVRILDGKIHLNSGGWLTMHTKKCINLIIEAYGYKVFQRKGSWYIHNLTDETFVDFKDGLVIDLNRKVA